MTNSTEMNLMPDPANGTVTKKQRLLQLAKEHRILRISAENGMGIDDAVRVIDAYSARMDQATFPPSLYSLLK